VGPTSMLRKCSQKNNMSGVSFARVEYEGREKTCSQSCFTHMIEVVIKQ
jgi:hypothetical protein